MRAAAQSTRFAALVVAVFALLFGRAAAAFTPPPIQGYVTDTAGKLSPQERDELERSLVAHPSDDG